MTTTCARDFAAFEDDLATSSAAGSSARWKTAIANRLRRLRLLGRLSPGQMPVSQLKPLTPQRSTVANTTLNVTPWTAAAASTFGHVVSCVVGFSGSSLSKMPQTASKSFLAKKAERMPMTRPNGL